MKYTRTHSPVTLGNSLQSSGWPFDKIKLLAERRRSSVSLSTRYKQDSILGRAHSSHITFLFLSPIFCLYTQLPIIIILAGYTHIPPPTFLFRSLILFDTVSNVTTCCFMDCFTFSANVFFFQINSEVSCPSPNLSSPSSSLRSLSSCLVVLFTMWCQHISVVSGLTLYSLSLLSRRKIVFWELVINIYQT